MVAERCVSKSGAVSADPHHTCRYGSSPAAHRLVVPALSFPSDREPSLYHRSRLASFYTRTDQPQPVDAIGPALRAVHGAASRAALSSCARCRTIALSRPPAPAQDCAGSCCAPPHATALSVDVGQFMRRCDSIDLIAILAMIAPISRRNIAVCKRRTSMNVNRRGSIGLLIGTVLGLGTVGGPASAQVKEPLAFPPPNLNTPLAN